MSIIPISQKHFEVCWSSVIKFSHPISATIPTPEELKQTFVALQVQNDLAYCERYKETPQEFFEELKEQKPLKNMWELLKALQCISYNIETKSAETVWLDNFISIITSYLICEHPDYKKAKWEID